MEEKNKVQFNLKNVHYAIIETSGEAVSWKTPVKVTGAVNLALEQQGLKVVQVYPNNRFIWAKDRDGNPTWVLVSFHHAAIKRCA